MSKPAQVSNENKTLNPALEQSSNPSEKPASRRVLTLFDCVCIIVGTIIGAGIFEIPATIANLVPNAYWLAGVWVFGGMIALIGALCFVELTTTYPDLGGDYGYLKRAYHRRVGFAFSWTAFWVIRPGNIGAMAMIFGKFAAKAIPGSLSPFAFAVLGVIAMTITNLMGVRVGKTTQNILTVAKVVGILLVVVAAFAFWPSQSSTEVSQTNTASSTDVPPATAESTETWSDSTDAGRNQSDSAGQPKDSELNSGWFWLALMFVMFTFGGWNDIAFVASEVREPDKNLLPALVIGTSVVLAVYLLVNFALLFGLGFEAMAIKGSQSQSATAALIESNMGLIGSRFFAGLVCVSCLGAINAMIFTSPRIYWATALDYPALSWLAGTVKGGGWWRAMLLQAVVTLALIATFGNRKDGFTNIVASTAPYFWIFLALTVITLSVNRIRFKNKFKGYRIPLGPTFPIIFVSACLFMIYRAWDYMVFKNLWLPTLLIGIWVLLGAALSFAMKSQTAGQTE